MLAPVIQNLKQRYPSITVDVLSLTMARDVYTEYGISFLQVRDFLYAEDYEARSYGERLADIEHGAHTSIPKEETIAYMGLSYYDLVRELGEEKAALRYAELGRMAFNPTTLAQRVISQLRPDVVVTTNSPRLEAALRNIATSRGILTIALTDLTGTFQNPLRADHVTVLSNQALARYQKSAVTVASNFHVIGNPAFDRLLPWRQRSRLDVRKRLFSTIPNNKRLILLDIQKSYYLGGQNYGYWTFEQQCEIIQLFHKTATAANAYLLVRPHPSLDPKPFETWIAKKEYKNLMMVNTYDLDPLLTSVDVVCSGHSTILIEALYAGNAVATYLHQNGEDLLELTDRGCSATIRLFDYKSTRNTLCRLLQGNNETEKQQRVFQKDFPDLPNSEKCVDLIVKNL